MADGGAIKAGGSFALFDGQGHLGIGRWYPHRPGQVDWFDTDDRSWIAADNNDEEGWAATAAWRRALADHADLLVEAQRVSSKRPSRALAGDAPQEDAFVLQTALRLHF